MRITDRDMVVVFFVSALCAALCVLHSGEVVLHSREKLLRVEE